MEPEVACGALRHGTAYAAHKFGCRCPDALASIRAQRRRQRERAKYGPSIDEIAVERAMYGDRVHLECDELRLAVERLTRQGLSGSAIAERLHITRRTVVRHRVKMANLTAGVA